MSLFFGWFLSLTAILLIVVVLIQRGRGGGLAGALGGGGGQSAFGTKAGDLFTKITIGLAFFWIVLCIFALWCLSPSGSSKFSAGSADEHRAPAKPGEALPAPVGGKSSGTPITSGAKGSASTPASTSGSATPATATPATSAPASKSAAPAAPATK